MMCVCKYLVWSFKWRKYHFVCKGSKYKLLTTNAVIFNIKTTCLSNQHLIVYNHGITSCCQK